MAKSGRKPSARRTRKARSSPVQAASPTPAPSSGATRQARTQGPQPIRQLTLEHFAALVDAFVADPANRSIDEVHVHHTWRPRLAEFRGRRTVEAMRRYHVETKGFADIAQHLTVDPAGGLWTGRSWNAPPASSAGRNGTPDQGPFMIEVVGDFDHGQDPFQGVQKEAVVESIAAILRAVPSAVIRFHRELGSPKSCPGTSIDRDAFVALVNDRARAMRAAGTRRAGRPRASPFEPEKVAADAVYESITATLADPGYAASEVPEHDLADAILRWKEPRAATPALGLAQRIEIAGERARSTEDWSELRPHVVNLSQGRLSTGGEFEMDPGSIDAILDGLRGYALTTARPNLVLFAHGGLVSEVAGLQYARSTRAWWLNHAVYPVFFVWESGFLDIILQSIVGPRAPSDLSDALIEHTTRPIGLPLWTKMKTSARLSSASDTGDGWPGGAWQFVNMLRPVLAELAAAGRAPGVQCVGHSAGAIFHSHLLPELAQQGIAIDSLSMLAPALRVDRFDELVRPLKDNGALKRLHLFTMNEEAELADTVTPLYRKSLLYLVSRAYEPRDRTPLLGLQESIDADPGLGQWLAANAEVEFSTLGDVAPNPLTQAVKHGDFDNDKFTMSAVLRRVKGVPDDPPEGLDDFPVEALRRIEVLEPVAMPVVGRDTIVAQPSGRRRALCVGVNEYSLRPLLGCVRDAKLWASILTQQGYEVSMLLDREATCTGIIEALRTMVKGSRAGDVLVFQYAGHGTQVADVDADDGDGYDEAFVPIDFEGGNLLLDDDLADISRELPAGVVLTLFMDCCHSGTISRFSPTARGASDGDERVRYLPLPPAVERAHVEQRRGQNRRSAAVESLPGVVHFAACRDDEFAYESNGQGDFTRSATGILARATTQRMTNEDFIDVIRAELAVRGRQHPGIMRLPANLRDRPLLSGSAPSRAEVAPADPRDDEALLAMAETLTSALRRRVGR
jgi:hypothetical protein